MSEEMQRANPAERHFVKFLLAWPCGRLLPQWKLYIIFRNPISKIIDSTVI